MGIPQRTAPTRNGNRAKKETMKKILPPTYFLGTIVLMIFLHFLLPIRYFLTFPWCLLGLIPIVIGIALNLSANHAFKKHHTTVKPFESSHTLVTHGVFRITRNPMYLGMTIITLGVALLLGSLTPLGIIVPVFAILLDRVFIVSEEKMLGDTFGDQFQEYQDRVCRWI